MPESGLGVVLNRVLERLRRLMEDLEEEEQEDPGGQGVEESAELGGWVLEAPERQP